MTDMATEFCTVAIDGHVITVTLNRPERRNALHSDASYELGDVFDRFDSDPDLWIAIVTGAGDKAFCAGADIVTDMSRERPPVPESGFAGLVWRFNRRKPVIAAVNGMAMGGGFETALAADIIIAAETATFGLTEPRVGLAALGGGIQRLVEELGPKRAHALLLTGRKISAQEAQAMGLVAEVVPGDQLLATARRWADEIMQCSPASIAATKAVVQSVDGHGLQHSMKDMFHLPEVRSLLTGPDAREGPRAFAEKRKPNWANPQ
ncbi:enoyl-CoA hydratase-related protein [Novosphingobium sp. JCM 18896]|uniref:enoyl-CoA hydratase-related protein n=1 Tax=Novosphingobium sp. JCM 18896 TaxID=2989731 RepID=UPI002223C8DE|nr:enoyl-CoA hydratase-related protein [Novosphingobium sp. JCM 18896]MCW1428656.1 enoyl-CoA hydratase-related protein [Novosphingobium sp. JCM 18896]